MPQTHAALITEQLCPPSSTAERHLETMLQISRALGRILDPNVLMEQILLQVTAAFDADRSTLFLYDAASDELWAKVAQKLSAPAHTLRIGSDQGIAGRVFTSHQPLLVQDTSTDAGFARQTATATGYIPRSMIVAPVLHRPDRCDGVLQVLHSQPGFFHEPDLALLEAIAVQVAISLENARLYDAQRRQFHSFVRAFSAALDARDPSTQEHSINVANLAMGIAWYLGMPPAEIQWLRIAGLLHDVGKIGTPEAVLRKPGKLDPAELEEMKKHAVYSRQILSQIEFTEEYEHLAEIASAHHEKLDGSGYPDGTRADELPLRARILAVADIFHALTQDRHYRKGMTLDAALRVIDAMTPHQLDAACVDALKRFLGCTVN